MVSEAESVDFPLSLVGQLGDEETEVADVRDAAAIGHGFIRSISQNRKARGSKLSLLLPFPRLLLLRVRCRFANIAENTLRRAVEV